MLEVNVINKRNLGKMIIRLIGHEGVHGKESLRRLLHVCIDFVQKNDGGLWENASIRIYDEDDHMYEIASGDRRHQFICRMNNGEPIIIDKNMCLRRNTTPNTAPFLSPNPTQERSSCTVS